MSQQMSHVQIIGLKTDLLATIRVLGALGCVHIDDVDAMPEFSLSRLTLDPAMARHADELNLRLLQVKGLIETLDIPEDQRPAPANGEDSPERVLEAVDNLLPVVQGLAARRDRLVSESGLLPRFLSTMRKLLPLFLSTVREPDHVSFGVLVNRGQAEVLDIIAAQVDDVTGGQAETAIGPLDATTSAMLIAVPRAAADAIGAMLDRHDVSRLRLPPEFDSSSPEAAIASLSRRLEAIPAEIAAIDRQLQEIAEQWSSRLRYCAAALQDELETYQVLPQLGQTETTFVLAGWVPTRQMPALQAALESEIGERILVSTTPMTEELERRAPVALENPGVARPFESLVHLYSTPRYGELDPSRFMALFMPIFFGMMLGDIGYGALLLVFTLWMRRRFKRGIGRDLANILALGAGWAIIFGLLFGELFGTLGESVGLRPLLFDRADSDHVIDLMALAISVGAAHIALGLLLGLWEAIRQHNRHALMERGGRLVGLIALFLLVGVLVDLLPAGFMTPAIALLIVGTSLLAWSLGGTGVIVAPIEMIGLVGNVLSYLRIAAIGLSSVYLALVANEMAGIVGSVVVGVIIAVLLHALNLVLGAFSPTIQSLRLHYVEFFRNFYEGGGRLYAPYRSRLSTRE